MSSVWSLNDVTLQSGSTRRLDRVSLEVQTGVTAVLGYSGAGKTSLLNLLVDFERPTSGSVRREIGNATLPVFWVPQNGGLWNHVSALKHVEMVLADVSGAAEWLDRFELSPRSHAMPSELSQGERARLSVARGLASDATALVMDEPLAHVDPARLCGWFDLIVDAVCSSDTSTNSLVFSTHQPELVLRYADNVVCLDAGECVFFGSVHDLYEKPADSRLATLLGHGNWISKDESSQWLDQDFHGPGVVRPERLRILPSDEQRLRVVTSRSLGSVTETTLAEESTGRERCFVHLTGQPIKAGEWVRLTFLGEDKNDGGE